jgi:hypothetical protein
MILGKKSLRGEKARDQPGVKLTLSDAGVLIEAARGTGEIARLRGLGWAAWEIRAVTRQDLQCLQD